MSNNRKRSPFLITMLCFGMAFLYIPMFMLVFYSFNHSKIVPIWGGFSTRWYTTLFESEEVWEAVILSLKIASISACFATILGTLAGIALVRFGRFKGHTLFSGMITAPLVMPEVITGLSLLLLFIALGDIFGWPEEAAQDLGAKPLRVLIDITLPLLMPGMLAGWLLAFTLSLDDLIIASFVSGPGSVTLPMLIYSRVRVGLTPEINALGTIIIVVVAIGVLLAGWLMLHQQKQRKLEEQLSGD
jgi:putrescine transport system permease protein